MSYEPVFQLALNHNYNVNDICQGLDLSPTAAASTLMKNLDMVLTYETNVYNMLGWTETPGNFFHKSSKSFCLSFYLVVNDALFNNYTNLPFFSNKQICVFDNVSVKVSGKNVFLHPKKFAGAGDVVLRTGLNAAIQVGVDGPVQIQNAVGAQVGEGKAVDGTLSFTAPGGNEGIYTLLQNGQELLRVCACNPPGNVPLVGYVELWYDPAVPQAAQFILPDGTIHFCDFVIAFDARKAYWNYLIVSEKYLNGVANIAVTDSTLSVFFDKKPKVTLFNDQTALSFLSPKAYKLSQQPDQTFQLRKNCIQGKKKEAGTVIIGKLPTADGSTIVPPVDGKPAYPTTPMIVYV